MLKTGNGSKTKLAYNSQNQLLGSRRLTHNANFVRNCRTLLLAGSRLLAFQSLEMFLRRTSKRVPEHALWHPFRIPLQPRKTRHILSFLSPHRDAAKYSVVYVARVSNSF